MKRRLSETRRGGAAPSSAPGEAPSPSGADAPAVVSLSGDPKLAAALGGREARALLLLSRNAARRGNSLDNDGVVRLLDVVAQRDALYFVFESAECDAHQFLRAVSSGVPLALQLEGASAVRGGGGSEAEASASSSSSFPPHIPPLPRSPAGGLPEACAAAWAGSLLRALAAVHAAGLVHRDVKPENLLVARRKKSGRQQEQQGAFLELPPLKLADFGLARPPPRGVATAAAAGGTGRGGNEADVEGGGGGRGWDPSHSVLLSIAPSPAGTRR